MRALEKIPEQSLKVAILQMTSGEDVQRNVDWVIQEIHKIAKQEPDIICLPENAFFLRIDKTKPIDSVSFKEPYWLDLQTLAKKINTLILIGSVAYKKSKKMTNATVAIYPGKKPKVVYEKIHLFDVDVAGAPPSRESDTFYHGRRPRIIKWRGWRIGLSICYDVRFSELYSYYAKNNVHLCLVPAAFLVPTGRAHWHTLLKARAVESQMFVVAPAQCGGHVNDHGLKRETYGHSLCIGPWGDTLIDMGEIGSAAVVVEIKPDLLLSAYRQIPMASHRRLK